MKISYIKHSITCLFLALFFTMKLAGFHVFSHAEDEDHATHCTICDHAITHNLTPIHVTNLQHFTLKTTAFFVKKERVQGYYFITSSDIAKNQRFSRPPPFLL